MFSCHDISERASAHFEGELSIRERMKFWLHLAICVHCRRYLKQLATVIGMMRLRAGRDEGQDLGQEEAFRLLSGRHLLH